MGHYSLILEKRYREFCEVYREKESLCKTNLAESWLAELNSGRMGRGPPDRESEGLEAG
ncbi:MAG: hypothetical protein HFG05_02850 [Oscillibacter sp.]|nr:hypothetical protein [Oscillibacter sp.]